MRTSSILVRIARRVAMRDERFEGVGFHLPSHVYDSDIASSRLDRESKQQFSDMIRAKENFQNLHRRVLGNPDTEKGSEKLFYAKGGLLDQLGVLTEYVKGKLARRVPRFDKALEKLRGYTFPFRDLWFVDAWVQYLHELVTAMFIACGGDYYYVDTSDDIPKELRQPDWKPGVSLRDREPSPEEIAEIERDLDEVIDWRREDEDRF